MLKSDCAASVKVAVAQNYLDSLISHDISGVRLAPDAKRFENGEPCGWSGPAILDALAHGEQYLPLRAIRELEFHEWDSNVVARYLLDLQAGPDAFATIRITEHFVIQTDEINAITAIYEPLEEA